MKLAGILLLLAGWMIVLASLVLFPQGAARMGFVFAGACLEVAGLAMAFRGHSRRGRRTA